MQLNRINRKLRDTLLAGIGCISIISCSEVFNFNRTETINNDKFENFFAGSSLNIDDTEIKKTLIVKGSLNAKNIATHDLTVNGYTTLTSSKVKGKSIFKKGATVTAVTFNDIVTFYGDALVTNCNFKMPVYINSGNVTFVNSKGGVIYPTGEEPSAVTLKQTSEFTDVFFYSRMGSVTLDKTSNILRPISGNQADDELVTTNITYHRKNQLLDKIPETLY